MPSPRAKTLAHLHALIAAATATAAATSTGCGKSKADKKPDDPYGSSGYAVVDPIPTPAIEPPPLPAFLFYTGRVKVAVTAQKGKRVFRLTAAETAPDLVFDDVVTPSVTSDQKKLAGKSHELIVTVDKTISQIVVSAHGEAGTFKVTASVDDAGAGAKVTLSE